MSDLSVVQRIVCRRVRDNIPRRSAAALFVLLLVGGLMSLPAVADEVAGDAEKEAGKPAVKQGPQKGLLEIRVETGKTDKTYTIPGKAMPTIARTAALQKRRPDDVAFRATITLNEEAWEFRSAEDAKVACMALIEASRRLPRVRLGLGDLDKLPDAAAITVAANTVNPRVEVQRRIQEALQKQMQPRPGATRPPMPNPLTIQRTINEVVKKAREEGLITDKGPATGVNLQAVEKDAVAMLLGKAFSTGTPTEPGAKEEEPAKKPAEPAGEKPEAEPKPEVEKPAVEKPATEKPAAEPKPGID